MITTLLILIAFLLVFANGFFVAAEFAMVKLRGTRLAAIKKSYRLRGGILENVHRHIDSYLSGCQLGITFTSLGLGWIGEPAIANLIRPFLHIAGIASATSITIISFFIAFGIISILHIVLGELVPKSIAIRKTEMVSLWSAIPLYIFYTLTYPIIWSLNICANFILQLFGIETEHAVLEKGYSPEEFKLILSTVHLREAFTEEEAEILKHVIEFSSLTVGDLIRPADEMIRLSLNVSIQENMNVIVHHRYSRYPLFEDKPDNIIGILHVKDLLVALQTTPLERINLADLIRPIIVTTPDTPANELLTRFRNGQLHFAIVKNKNGDVNGFITLDNILRIILGNIQDEFNKMKPDWQVMERGILLMKGTAPIYALERALGIEVQTKANTISGLIMTHLERLPQPKERICFQEFDIIVSRMKGPKLLLVKIFPKNRHKNTF